MTPDPNALDQSLVAAWTAYCDGAIDDACGHARQALQADQHNGRAWFALACCQERLGRLRNADRSFLKARQASRDPQPTPWRTTWRHFTNAVQRAAEALPAEIQQHLESVELSLRNYPTPLIARAADNPECLSWFSGPTAREKRTDEPSRISLFRRSHEHCTASQHEFDREVAASLYAELGRYLDLSAGDMDQLGLLGP